MTIKIWDQNTDKQKNSLTTGYNFDDMQNIEKPDQRHTTIANTQKNMIVVFSEHKKNKGTRKAVPIITDKYGYNRASGIDIDDFLYDRPFDGRPMNFLKTLNIWNKLDMTPILLQDRSKKTKAIIYRDDEWKFILLIYRYGFFDKITFDMYDELDEGIKDVFGSEENVKVSVKSILEYNNKSVNQKSYTKNVEPPIHINIDRERSDIEAKQKGLQEWWISLDFYGSKEVFDERSKKKFKIRVKKDEEEVLKIIDSLDKEKIEEIFSNSNIQKLRSVGIKIPLGRVEELLGLDKEIVDKLIRIYTKISMNIYDREFKEFASLDDTIFYKAEKLKIAWIDVSIRDIEKCGELSEEEIIDAIKNDKVKKLKLMWVKVMNIPEDVQILASIDIIMTYRQDFRDNVNTITKNGLKMTLREIKSLIYMGTMVPFVNMRKNIWRDKKAWEEIQETRDGRKIWALKERIKQETDITLSIIDDTIKALAENDLFITKWSEYSYQSKIVNDILEKLVYPRIGSMDGETQKTIVLTVAGYVGDCFSIEHYIKSPEYKDNPEKLLCAVRGIDVWCLEWKVTMEREWGSIVFYVENELDYMKVCESQEHVFWEKWIYKDIDWRVLWATGWFSTSYSKIYQLANTVTVINGPKERLENAEIKKHELRHSLDNRLMIIWSETAVMKSMKMEILAYMINGYSQEKIQQMLLESGLYTHAMNRESKEWQNHIYKVERYIKDAFKVKALWIDHYMNRLAITPINRWSMLF